MALVNVRARRGDYKLDERQVVVFELEGDKVTNATFIYERPEIYDGFWSD